MSLLLKKQPTPTTESVRKSVFFQNNQPRNSVEADVINDLIEKAMDGKEKYGTFLTTNNGRSALIDLYQELLDATLYTTLKYAKVSKLESVLINKEVDATWNGFKICDFLHIYISESDEILDEIIDISENTALLKPALFYEKEQAYYIYLIKLFISMMVNIRLEFPFRRDSNEDEEQDKQVYVFSLDERHDKGWFALAVPSIKTDLSLKSENALVKYDDELRIGVYDTFDVDALLYSEVLDALMYAKQYIMEENPHNSDVTSHKVVLEEVAGEDKFSHVLFKDMAEAGNPYLRPDSGRFYTLMECFYRALRCEAVELKRLSQTRENE